MTEACEYCGDMGVHEIGGIIACNVCYAANFGGDGEHGENEPCSICDSPSNMMISGEPYCKQCFDDDDSLTEEDVDQ